MQNRQQLHSLVDQLPDSEVLAAVRYLEFLTSRESPVDPEMLAWIDDARTRPAEGIAHEGVLREFGL